MPKTRFLSTYCSEFARRIGEDGVESRGSLGDEFPWGGNGELVGMVTSSNSTVPSRAVSSKLNPLELSVRKPFTSSGIPPKAWKAAKLFGLNILESCPGEKAKGLSST